MPRPRNLGRPPAVLGTSSSLRPLLLVSVERAGTRTGDLLRVLVVLVVLANYSEDILRDHVKYIMVSGYVSEAEKRIELPSSPGELSLPKL